MEVNPLTKKQLKWTSHKKVPVVLIDNELVDDSSLILSRLAVEYEPQVEPPKAKGWFAKTTKVSANTLHILVHSWGDSKKDGAFHNQMSTKCHDVDFSQMLH